MARRKHDKAKILEHARRYLNGSLKIMTENNHKIVLNEKLGFKTIGINFAPAKTSKPYGGGNFCAKYTPGCFGSCLENTGHNIYSTADFARIARSVAYTLEPETFQARVCVELERFFKRTKRAGLEPSVRVNLLSDQIELAWALSRKYEDVQFTDYTKRIDHVTSLLNHGAVSPNMSWGLSLSESNWQEWRHTMDRGLFWGAVVIDAKKGEAIPQTFDGLHCVDGDLHDARWLTPKGCVAVLRLKGSKEAKRIARKGFAIPKEDSRWHQ